MAIAAFATTADVAARWRPLTADETDRASVLLEDATALMMASGAEDDGTDARAAVLKSVCCSMVIRALSAGSGFAPVGVSQYSQTVGAVSESWSMSNPGGDLYLTRSERKALGIGGCRAWRAAPPEVRHD